MLARLRYIINTLKKENINGSQADKQKFIIKKTISSIF